MPRKLEEMDWQDLIMSIREGRCTPFLGAGACYGVLPLGCDIARELAVEHNYPLNDDYDLARVTQFVGVTRNNSMKPKFDICRRLRPIKSPDFTQPDEPHGVLAQMPLPIYLTTNYDGFMVEALKHAKKSPQREICHWNRFLKDDPSVFSKRKSFGVSPATVPIENSVCSCKRSRKTM